MAFVLVNLLLKCSNNVSLWWSWLNISLLSPLTLLCLIFRTQVSLRWFTRSSKFPIPFVRRGTRRTTDVMFVPHTWTSWSKRPFRWCWPWSKLPTQNIMMPHQALPHLSPMSPRWWVPGTWAACSPGTGHTCLLLMLHLIIRALLPTNTLENPTA